MMIRLFCGERGGGGGMGVCSMDVGGSSESVVDGAQICLDGNGNSSEEGGREGGRGSWVVT